MNETQKLAQEIKSQLPSLSTDKLHGLETRIATEHLLRVVSGDQEGQKILQDLLRSIAHEFKQRST